MSATKFLLFEDFEFPTGLSPDAVSGKLETHIEKQQYFLPSLFKSTTKSYSGHVTGDSFVIWRNSLPRNFFRPLVKGTAVAEKGNMHFRIRLHMSITSVLLLLPFLLFIVYLVIAMADEGFTVTVLLPLLMLLILYIWALTSLQFETRKTKQFLLEVFSNP